MIANYHTHTKRCKHAEGEDREYVEAAIQAGIKELGFSDHCPWIYKDDFVSGIRMTAGETEGYVHSLESLRKEYADDIRIYIGFEAEYMPELMEAQDKLLQQYPIDYLLLGQHFLGEEANSIYMGSPIREEAVIKKYVDTVIEGLESGRYLYLAHPDLVHFVGDSDIYYREMSRLCRYLKQKNLPIEINMLGAFQGRHYPSEKFLEIAREVGNTAIIGVDAHSPEQLINPQGERLCREFAKGLELLERLELDKFA